MTVPLTVSRTRRPRRETGAARRFVGGLSAVLATVLLLSGCANSTSAGRGGDVSVLVFGGPHELAAYRTLVKAYEQANPGKRVQLVETSDRTDLIARFATSVAGGAPPDIVLINYRFYGQFAAKGALEPLGGRLASSSLDRGMFFPEPLRAFQWGGKQMCLPQNVSSLAVYYNRDLFKRYGVREPKAGWRWNDLLAAATSLTRDAKGAVVKGTETEGTSRVAVYGLGVEPDVIRVAPFVWSDGGEIVDDPDRPTRFTFDSPRARPALRDFLALRQAYGVVPTDEEVESEDLESRFTNGRLAMVMTSRRATPTFRAITDFEWDVAPLPNRGAPVTILHSDAYCVARQADQKDDAWRFIEYALGEEGATIMARTGRTVPSNVKVAKSPAFLDPGQPPRNAEVFLDAVANVRYAPTVSTWPEIEDVSNDLLENAFYRGDPLDEVLAELDRRTRPLFARGEHP